VTTADVQDRDAPPDLLKAVSAKSPWVKLAFVDGGYAGDETQRAAYEPSLIGLPSSNARIARDYKAVA
jgi:hypothetical protein